MIKQGDEELIEGGKYLQAYENSFNPELKESRELYSLQLIENSLEKFKLGEYMEQIIEIIIFDSIIYLAFYLVFVDLVLPVPVHNHSLLL